jgi:hypothetical protein
MAMCVRWGKRHERGTARSMRLGQALDGVSGPLNGSERRINILGWPSRLVLSLRAPKSEVSCEFL